MSSGWKKGDVIAAVDDPRSHSGAGYGPPPQLMHAEVVAVPGDPLPVGNWLPPRLDDVVVDGGPSQAIVAFRTIRLIPQLAQDTGAEPENFVAQRVSPNDTKPSGAPAHDHAGHRVASSVSGLSKKGFREVRIDLGEVFFASIGADTQIRKERIVGKRRRGKKAEQAKAPREVQVDLFAA